MIIDHPYRLRHDILKPFRSRYHVRLPAWDSMAYCVMSKVGHNVRVDYIGGSSTDFTLRSFDDFIEMLRRSSATFVCDRGSMIDACIALSKDESFIKPLLASDGASGKSSYKGWHVVLQRFAGGEQKLTIMKSNEYHFMIDIAAMAIDRDYNRLDMHLPEDVRDFVEAVLSFCLAFDIPFANSLRWAELGQNLFLKHVHFGPDWLDPLEAEFQIAFLEDFKGPKHDMRVRGPDNGSNLDGIRCHLNIFRGMPSPRRLHNEYDTRPYYNPDASYGCYTIRTRAPKELFCPLSARFEDGWCPNVYGEGVYRVLKDTLDAMMWVYRDRFKYTILEAHQIIPKGRLTYPYRYLCERLDEMLDNAPNNLHIQSLYQRIGGKLISAYEVEDKGELKMQMAPIVDYIVGATLRDKESSQTWLHLMDSINPQHRHVDGHSAGRLGAYDSKKFKASPPGPVFGLSNILKDKEGSSRYLKLVEAQADRKELVVTGSKYMSLREVLDEGIPLSWVGELVMEPRRASIGNSGRDFPEWKRVGDLLERAVGEPLSGDRAKIKDKERHEKIHQT